MSGSHATWWRSFIITAGSVVTKGFMDVPVNTAPLKGICRKNINNIFSGMVSVSLNGPKRLALIPWSRLDLSLIPHKVEQQGYKACIGLLKLADKYSTERLEAACTRALSYTPRPSLKSVKNILVTGQDKVTEEVRPPTAEDQRYGFTRGAEYYGGK